MVKKNAIDHLFFLLGIFLALNLAGVEFQDLTDDCSGQILMPTVGTDPVVFLGCGADGQWKYTLSNDSDILEVAPGGIAEILPLYMDSDPFEVISYTLAQVLPRVNETPEERQMRENRLAICKELLCNFPSPRTATLQRCLADIDAEEREVNTILRSGQDSRFKGNAMIDRYLQGNPFASIRSAMAASDFQIAIPCYFRLREVILDGACHRLAQKYREDLKVLFDKFGRELQEAYGLQADGCAMRVSRYLSVCPGEVGHWKQGAPATLEGLREMASKSLESFEKSLAYSPTLDFRHWGNAMLGVFRLLPNSLLVKTQATEFDKALQNYSDKHK